MKMQDAVVNSFDFDVHKLIKPRVIILPRGKRFLFLK